MHFRFCGLVARIFDGARSRVRGVTLAKMNIERTNIEHRMKNNQVQRCYHATYSYPFGLFRCQRHASEHISAMPYLASHPNWLFAFDGSA